MALDRNNYQIPDAWNAVSCQRSPNICHILSRKKRCRFGQEDVQAAGGGVLVVGDQLLTYVSGRSKAMKLLQTGLLTLRRDGCKMLTLSRF